MAACGHEETKATHKQINTLTSQGMQFCNNTPKLTRVMTLESENVWLPCKGIKVVMLVIFILI